MRKRLAATAVGVVAALTMACGQRPASIQVTPTRVKIYGIERPMRLAARVLDQRGQPLAQAPPINWSSSKADVVEVDASGRLLSKKEGKAAVTATVDRLSTQVAVEVLDVKGVEVSPLAARLVGPAGSALPLQAVVRNSRDQAIAIPVTWSSSDERVATVSPDGVVTSVGAGRATVVAKVGDLQTGAEVNVDTRLVSKLVLLPATALVHVGDSQHYQISVYGPDGREIEGASARFASSDPSVASVDPAGVASGKKSGVATIRAQVGNLTAEAT
ncbi:MAG TPA: Ig-like domain-containing protein, partial [Thermoanaerobaculia bacterium]|nr:Ig-like domain-containing protein [Thermoanaerobaculia bacterium]